MVSDYWADIPEFPDYQVTRFGLVRKKKYVLNGLSRLVLSQTVDPAGYVGVKLKHESKVWKRVKVHVIVLRVFVGPRPDGLVINHIDGDKTNNSLENLEYCTQLANERHSLDVLGKTHLRGPNGCFISTNSTERVV